MLADVTAVATSNASPPALRLAGVGDGPGESDAQLVRQLRGGDAAAGERLVLRYERPLGGYLRRLAGSTAAAEDLLQATWLSVLEHLDQFDADDSRANFKAWLFRIASNKSHDHWRRAGRARKAADGLRLVTDHDDGDAARAAVAGEDARRLRAAVDALPGPQRQVVLMRYYGGLKFVEIAEALGCPLNTALGRMHKAMQKLRTHLDDGTY